MYRAAKGVYDILPKDSQLWKCSHLWAYVEEMMRKIATCFCYREIRTPLFESTELFTRSIGEGTDIVTKEMYTFLDKAERSLTLRPEGTAPVMRAFIEKHLHEQGGIHRLFYIGPMFRYERQQAGRYRQHHQFGVEAIGSPLPHLDCEVIDLLFSLLKTLHIRGLSLQINSIGDQHARQAYVSAFREFLHPHLNELSEDSRRRFETNPLRILDSKDAKDIAVVATAPSILDFLSSYSKERFDQLLALLRGRNIPYTVNPHLVRGLDYYNDTVFEVTSCDLGAQNSLGGGGRYDGLIKQLGGPDLPSFGFGTGIERILHVLINQEIALPDPPTPKVLLVPMGEEALNITFDLASQLRDAHICCEMELSKRRLKTVLGQANEANISYVAVIGEEELKESKVQLKHMPTGQSETIAFDALVTRLSDV